MQRKLAAIVSADIVGYSRLIDLDEVGTHSRVKDLLTGFLSQTISEHGGTLIKLTGDGALITFESVVDAVECSVDIQGKLAHNSETIADDSKLVLRIGVNLGDIIIDDDDVYGQGVNIAVRLQEIAQSGSVYVSQSAVEHARGKAVARFDPIGRLSLKNISEPVEVFRALPGNSLRIVRKRTQFPKTTLGIIGISLLVAAGAIGGFLRFHKIESEDQIPTLVAMVPPPPVTDAVAVLPFMDLSSDTTYQPFVEGVFDDLITDLSKLSQVTVMAKNSVEAYRSRDIAPLAVAKDLRVRYILEGSVRRINDSLRINVRLVDSREQSNIWAEQYSGPLANIFSFEDDIVVNIVNSLAIKISDKERSRILTRETESVPAYDAFRKGESFFLKKTPESLPAALAAFQEAIKLDPGYSQAYAGIGQVYWNAWVWGWESSIGETWETAPGFAKQYLEKALQRPTAPAYQLASDINLYARKFDDSLEFARLAVEFAPNDPDSHLVMAESLIYSGRPEEAVPWIEAANRLQHDAADKVPPYNVWVLGMAYFGQQKYAEAASQFEEALKENPEDFGPAAPLAAAYWYMAGGTRSEKAPSEAQLTAAKDAIAKYYTGWTDANIEDFIVYWPFRNKDDEDRLVGPLRLLGMPEKPAE